MSDVQYLLMSDANTTLTHAIPFNYFHDHKLLFAKYQCRVCVGVPCVCVCLLFHFIIYISICIWCLCSFELRLRITLSAGKLILIPRVRNTDTKPFSFAFSLCNYLSVSDIRYTIYYVSFTDFALRFCLTIRSSCVSSLFWTLCLLIYKSLSLRV
jgi:hypothetical protein